MNFAIWGYIDGLAQDCNNSSALAMELLQSWAKPNVLELLQSCAKSSISHSSLLQDTTQKQKTHLLDKNLVTGCILIASGAVSDGKFVKMTFPFQCTMIPSHLFLHFICGYPISVRMICHDLAWWKGTSLPINTKAVCSIVVLFTGAWVCERKI